MNIAFTKYHALGNDYIVIDPMHLTAPLTTEQVKLICHRNFGVGSDGILLGPLPSASARCALKIYNPDGSIAEKSGNGVRIFSRYLWDTKFVGNEEFALQTDGGIVRSTVFDGGKMVRVEMGKVSFDSEKIPVTGLPREVINETISVGGCEFTFCAATIGNPHCVVPLKEMHPNFPRKTNVQFLKVLDRANIAIEIWERGAGYTLASGSSSSASAAVAHKLGLVDKNVTVQCPGGLIEIEIRDGFDILMTGSVTRVAEGAMAPEMFTVKPGCPAQ